MWGHLEIKFNVLILTLCIMQINVYVIQIFLGITINSFENNRCQKYETLIAMGCFNWGYPYSQMLHNIKSCNLTTKIDRENIS